MFIMLKLSVHFVRPESRDMDIYYNLLTCISLLQGRRQPFGIGTVQWDIPNIFTVDMFNKVLDRVICLPTFCLVKIRRLSS